MHSITILVFNTKNSYTQPMLAVTHVPHTREYKASSPVTRKDDRRSLKMQCQTCSAQGSTPPEEKRSGHRRVTANRRVCASRGHTPQASQPQDAPQSDGAGKEPSILQAKGRFDDTGGPTSSGTKISLPSLHAVFLGSLEAKGFPRMDALLWIQGPPEVLQSQGSPSHS